jgi:hypothetical protein
MATTTNYGWTTPDDTALVKDGASAIRTLGTSVDTTTKNLHPSTTLGDIEYRSSTANTNTRLGIGTTGQVLSVSGGVPAWATVSSGAMTLISTTTLSGATTTVGSIPSGYQQLFVRGFGITNATAAGVLRVALNADTNLSSYSGVSPVPSAIDKNQQRIELIGQVSSSDTYFRAGGNNAFSLTIDNYASSTAHKSYAAQGGGEDNVTSFCGGYHKSNTAITSLVFDNTGGDFSAGTIQLYGVK